MDDDFDDSIDDPSDMSDPDWARAMVRPPGGMLPVGDASRWGAQDLTVLAIDGAIHQTPQILQIQTRDPYARSWSLLGTLAMPTTAFAMANIEAVLQVTMGVGQAQILHEIELWLGSASAGGPGGLCYQQDSLHGGVYTGTAFLQANSAGVPTGYTPKPFAIVGGLIGQSIAVRARYGALGVNADLPAPIILSVIVTPYAAGQGL